MKRSQYAPIAIGIASLFLLTSCGASGQGAPTRNIKQVTDGVEKDSGSIFARNVLLVAQPDGSAVLVGTFINEGATADLLTAMSINGVALKFDKPSYDLLQNKPLIFSGPTANAHAVITGLNAAAGSRVKLSVTYGKTPSITIDVLVREKDSIYANVG
jgi:hypothetical protein